MPLPDGPWESGKCGFKIIQYMAAGLPVIASPVGANAEIVRHCHTGFLAESQADWVEAITTLTNVLHLRREMGFAGRQRVEQDYSISRAADTWAQLLAE